MDDAKQIIDTLVLIGVSRRSEQAYHTHYLDDDLLAQELYYYIGGISGDKSLNKPPKSPGHVLMFHVLDEHQARFDDWFEQWVAGQGINAIVPEDFHLTPTMAGLLLKANGITIESSNGTRAEIQIPQLCEQDALRLRQAFADVGVHVEGGMGVEPLRIEHDALTSLREYAVTPSEAQHKRVT